MSNTREIEGRVGVNPLDILQADRSQYMGDLAELRAFSTGFDGNRKAFRSVILLEKKQAYLDRKEKAPGFELLEAEASADDRYHAWLAGANEKLAQKELLEMRVQEITEIINRDQALIRFASAERASTA